MYMPLFISSFAALRLLQFDAVHESGPATGFGYTVSRAILIQVYGILWSKSRYKVFSFFGNLEII